MEKKQLISVVAGTMVYLVCTISPGAESELTAQEKIKLKRCYACLSESDLAEYMSLPETKGFGIGVEREKWLQDHCSIKSCAPLSLAFSACPDSSNSDLIEYQSIEDREQKLIWLSTHCDSVMNRFYQCHTRLSSEDQDFFLSSPVEMRERTLVTLCPDQKTVAQQQASVISTKKEGATEAAYSDMSRPVPKRYRIVAHCLFWPGLTIGSLSLVWGIATAAGVGSLSSLDDTNRTILTVAHFADAAINFTAMFIGIAMAIKHHRLSEKYNISKLPTIYISKKMLGINYSISY